MPISKNIPMALNKSSDERLLKANEMTDAKNVTISTDENGNGFVLKNARGNLPIVDESGSSVQQGQTTNSYRVLGSCVDAEANTLYFIVYDNANKLYHTIYRIDFNNSTLKYEKVLMNQYLFGDEPEFVDMDVIRVDVNQSGSIKPILYFTDNISEPKKVNVERAISNNYAYNADITEFLSVAKTKPVHQFTIVPKKDSNFSGNFIYGKSFSFAVQWVYQDGERSALSNISDCVIPQTVLTTEEDGSRKDDINYYLITIPKGDSSEVKQINVYYRDNDTGLMYLSDRLERDTDLKRSLGSSTVTIYDSSESTYRFYGDRDQEPAPLIETNKLFDSVPLRAKTQCIADGRLMYGNYVEGRDLPDVEANFSVSYDDPFNDNYLIIGASEYAIQLSGFVRNSSAQNYSGIELDLSKIPDTVKAGSTISLDFSFLTNERTTWITTNSTSQGAELITFEANGQTWHIGRKSASTSFWPAIFKELGDIRFIKSYEVASDTNKTTLISDLTSVLESTLATVKYRNADNANTIATRLDDNQTITVTINEADLRFTLDAAVKSTDSNVLQCSLIYNNSSNIKITHVSATPYAVTNETGEAGGISGNSRGFTGVTRVSGDDLAYQHPIKHSLKAIVNDTNQLKSFKRGANHTFGMIFYDKRGRSSFVKELGSVYVETKGEQAGVTNGKASISVTFPQVGGANQTLPSWVDKYQIVYGGSDIDEFKQYTVSGGFANYWSYSDFDNTDSKEDASKNIYVSLKGWSGSKSSYTGENGADYAYNPKEGDVLRVVRYDINDTAGSETRFYPENLEFYVVGKTTLRKDVIADEINLIRAEIDFENKRDENKQKRRDKRAQKRKDKGKDGPGLRTRIGRGLDKFADKFNEFAEDRPFLDRVFTNRDEKMEDLLDAEEDARNKIKDTPLSARNPVFPGGSFTYDANGNPAPDAEDMPMAKGDFLILKDPGVSGWGRGDSVQVYHNGTSIVDASSQASDGVQKHWFAILNWARNVVVEVYTPGKTVNERVYVETPDVHTYSTSLDPSTPLSINTGDVWLKRVPAKHNKKETDATNKAIDHHFRYWDIEGMFFKNTYLESQDASHFFPSDARVFGRSHFVNRYASENHRRHSITYSDRYSSDSPFLNLSNFNLSRSNFVDLDSSYGGVDRLFSNDGYLNCVQSGKVSRLPLGQVNVQLGSTTDALTSADTIIGRPSYYAGDYGTRGKTQMSLLVDGNIFFTDTTAKKVFQVTGNGLSAISDINMDSFFQEKIGGWHAAGSSTRVFMGYDPDYDEVLVAFGSKSSPAFEGFVAAYNVGLKRWTTTYDFSSSAGYEPTHFASIGSKFISCLYTTVGGAEYLFFDHTEDGSSVRGKYYGSQKACIVEVVVNENPSMVKVFESVSLEGNNGGWTAAITNTDQNTTIGSGLWEERERGYYAMMPRDLSSNSTSHRIYIPTPVSTSNVIGDNTISFDSKVNRLGLPVGAELYNKTKDQYVTGSSVNLTISSVASNEITVSDSFTANDNVEDGDILYAVLAQNIYGDAIRDYFCKIKLTVTTGSDLELYSINTHYDRSKLGQEKG